MCVYRFQSTVQKGVDYVRLIGRFLINTSYISILEFLLFWSSEFLGI